MLNYTLILVQVLVWAAFAASTVWYFERPAGTPPFMKALSIAGLLALVVSVLGTAQADISTVRAVVSGALLACSVALFLWACVFLQRSRPNIAFTREAPRQIETGGPFRVARHPFYTAYLLYWSGCGFAMGWPLGVIPVALMLPFYVFAARQEERYMLMGSSGEDYRRFMRRTGRFWPFQVF